MIIGALLGGAGVVTNFPAQAECNACILIGDVDTAVPITALKVTIDGKAFVAIDNAQTLIAAWAKWKMKAIQGSAVVGMIIRVASGRIGRNTTYSMTNAGATTPNVMVFSDMDNGVPLEAATNTINASSAQVYKDFAALFVATPGAVSSYEVVFSNGFNQTFLQQEFEALFAAQYDSEANGELGGVTAIDNSDQKFASIKMITNAAVVVLTVRTEQAAFRVLNQGR